ncbi:MAG: ATP-binding protein [Bdellovibrionota bacterium]
MSTEILEKEVLAQTALQEAFAKFNEASGLLESKYSALKFETERLREQLKEKDLEIKRGEKLAMLGETAAGIAHEVRNPLGAIKLFISILREDLREAPESVKILDQMDKSVATLDHVVSNILQFSKVKKVEFSPVNLASLINEQVSHFTSENNQLQFSLKIEGQPFISGNEHSLRQVFYNLLLNACQAIKYSGKIEVRAHDSDEEHYIVEVRDSGSGIPEDMLLRLFEPFATSKNEGTGLGLSIVKQILDEHGAFIEAYNAGGAVFKIRFNRKLEV